MAEKLKKCGECRERAVSLVVKNYDTPIDHDGRTYAVHVPNLEVFKCGNCGAEILGVEALERVMIAFRKTAGLLSPAEIKQKRTALGLTQEQLADVMGLSHATVCRWETGAQIQQRTLNKFLRLVFDSADVRRRLGLGGKTESPHSDLTSYEITSMFGSETGGGYTSVVGGNTTTPPTLEV